MYAMPSHQTFLNMLLALWNGNTTASAIITVSYLVTCFVLPLFDVWFIAEPAVFKSLLIFGFTFCYPDASLYIISMYFIQ